MATAAQSRTGLRIQLDSGVWAVPLDRVHHLGGFATLSGQGDDYFRGWLLFHGQQVPVFDLNQVACEQPTPATFGARIVIVETAAGAPTPLLGLLAAGVTDTVPLDAPDVQVLDLNLYLPMLYSLTPPPPEAA